MLSYAERLAELSRISQRLFDIAPTGLSSSSGGPLSESGILRIADGCETGASFAEDDYFKLVPDGRGSSQPDPAPFLHGEKEALTRLISGTVGFINENVEPDKKKPLPEDLKSLLKRLDYVHLFFPDYPAVSSDHSFLKRLLHSAAWFRDMIGRADCRT